MEQRKVKFLTYEDRKRLEIMCKARNRVVDMAVELDISPKTIYREFKRAGIPVKQREIYNADVAQQHVLCWNVGNEA
ncbi:MAG: helix-turn-helix domain-containing protein [Roseburia sp.]|nr:helix-turn-helix domain-containing protein [Roseburia sp.]